MSLYDNQTREFTIPPQCPWYQAQQAYGAPNVNWCEKTYCSHINEPANTWSNLSFLIVGLLILKKFEDTYIRTFAFIVLLMGFFSAVYHATNNYLSQHLDFLGMSLMTSFILAFEFKRMLKASLTSFYTYFWFFVALNMMTIIVLNIVDIPIQTLLLINGLPILILDLYCGVKDKVLHKYVYFFIGLLLLIAAQISAQIDLKRVYCVEESLLLHGHVIWHLLSGSAMGFIALHMQRVHFHDTKA